jgi:hypothetical protein
MSATRTRRSPEAIRQAALDRLSARQARADAGVASAKAALARAQARLEKALAAQEAARAAAELAARQEAKKNARPPAGTLTSADGQVLPLDATAVKAVRAVVGRARRGVLPTIAGEHLLALDPHSRWGDEFVISIRGRKSRIRFRIEAEGLAFEAVAA